MIKLNKKVRARLVACLVMFNVLAGATLIVSCWPQAPDTPEIIATPAVPVVDIPTANSGELMPQSQFVDGKPYAIDAPSTPLPPRALEGIREFVVITALNTRLGIPEKYWHEFRLAKQPHFRWGARHALYEDLNSELMLMVCGEPSDLVYVSLLMPVGHFADEGKATEGAAAFGRCVQRMAAAVDPIWMKTLHQWMADNLTNALFTAEGAATEHKTTAGRNVIVDFYTQQVDSRVFLTFMIKDRELSNRKVSLLEEM